MKRKTKKILLVTIISSYFATVSSAFAFVWPVINLQKISTTVKNINNMITEVTNVTAQAKTTVEKINAIGDVIGSIEKYANQIQNPLCSGTFYSAFQHIQKCTQNKQTNYCGN